MIDDKDPDFTPPSRNVTIWRYMDTTKLLAMLSSGSLFFCRLDLLEDSFEGSISRADLTRMISGEEQIKRDKGVDVGWRRMFKKDDGHFKKRVGINCWHMNNHESMAMWAQYASRGQGIAVKATYERLVRALGDVKDHHFSIGIVSYVDYGDPNLTGLAGMNQYLFKRKNFEHEQELRVIRRLPQRHPKSAPFQWQVEDDPRIIRSPGLNVKVNLLDLIEAIHLAPQTPTWKLKAIRAIAEKYGIPPDRVKQSQLDETAIW